MDVRSAAQTVIGFLRDAEDVTRMSEIRRASLGASRKITEADLPESRDSLSIRLGKITYAHARLMRTHDEAGIGQSRHTIAQDVKRGLSLIQSELSDIEHLTDAVAAGGLSSSQLNDIQIMIESRLARIDAIVSGTTFAGQELFTGDFVRITTDVISEAGFDVRYPEMDTEALRIDTLDVNTMSSTTASEMVSTAITTVESAISDVEAELTRLGSGLEEKFGELKERFAELRESEKLNIADETRWLQAKSLRVTISNGDLKNISPSIGLTADVVSSALK